MKQLRLQAMMVLATMLLFVAMLAINEWLFTRFEFARGINWIYLPAGIRLLCTLLFAEAGAIGLLLVSWLVCFFFFFPDDPVRSFVGGILASLAPYLIYRIAEKKYGLHASLTNLTPKRLHVLIVTYSVASPLLHHIWFALQGQQEIMQGFLTMFVGDLMGTLLVIYSVKAALSLLPSSPHGLR
ncbi:hypothetical protein [Polaromonas sp.]|uniref:hypothetical protein n=1 Tax=Polaromonas sp. TaxID=1869339 RepID=UPI0013BA4F90|nr:hypothetical protein [Polaromonas sp.]NDP63515.1 hypothetical protein [Polaromonas sp.]